MLDFTSCSDQMGKPTSADLKLGLATGPVLFACQQVRFPNSLRHGALYLPGSADGKVQIRKMWESIYLKDLRSGVDPDFCD